MLLKTRHSISSYCYCRFSKQRIFRFSPTKGTILYWNKLESLPSKRACFVKIQAEISPVVPQKRVRAET